MTALERIIPSEARAALGMKNGYDFSQAVRGPVLKTPPGKTRITIRIDDDILLWFREQVDAAGGGNYQTLMKEDLCGAGASEHHEADGVP